MKASNSTHHVHWQNRPDMEHNGSTDASCTDPSLLDLRVLVRKMITATDRSGINPEIMQAISMLDNIFRNQEGQRSRTVEDPQASLRDERKNAAPAPAPALPPILDEQLEKAVFTHSACNSTYDANYDRLEILGDAYIELIATKLVWRSFPGIPAGRISQIRELLVKNETLAAFADNYGFDRKASMPISYSTQPKRLIKTKGDIFEAYVAAVILSRPTGGYRVAEEWLTALWLPKLSPLVNEKVTLRSKEALAQQIMGKGIKLEYQEERPQVQQRGTGTQTFFVGVYLTGWGWTKRHLGSGQGSSKAAAGDEAAKMALSDTNLLSEIITAKRSHIAKRE
ncbi:hypothetical protein N7462_000254 [Penicillium macrosclerotiorum]|uniref:uncharacterized protein n=1 Tax=Penicillium macrosclerotiorum TaxID=303699 RepID=UPI0025476D40|nr:uncharacterized protein N7462_000254 [Penicillium macrosclerotiorum]KAJ5698249.1 hypothetical protein N7462_000254 [Penicillium macrosclerotiorum]